MSHQQLNSIFSNYTPSLYKAAQRMIDKRHPQFEDKVQDLIVLAYEVFTRKAGEGKIMELPLVINYMKFRRAEVQIEMRGYSRTNKRDVFNKRNYYEGRLELYSVHNPVFEGEDDTYADNISAAIDIETEVSFKIDIEQKLSHLSQNERTIIDMKVSGFGDEEISQCLSVQVQTVKNALNRLSSRISGISQFQLELSL